MANKKCGAALNTILLALIDLKEVEFDRMFVICGKQVFMS